MDVALQKIALILLIEPSLREIVKKSVEDAGHRCIFSEDKEEAKSILQKEEIALLVCYIQNKSEDFAFFDFTRRISPACKTVAIIDKSLENFFPELLLRAYPLNLIADNELIDHQELDITIKKLLSGEIFGMSQYGVPVHESITLNSSAEKFALIKKATDFFLQKGVTQRLLQNIELILDELLMNAIFDAPIEKGKQKYYHLSRSTVIDLPEVERPQLEYGMSENQIGLAVSDPFGAIKAKTVFSYVNRCFAKNTPIGEGPGTGMGLFLVFKSLNKLVINVANRKKSEVIALINYPSSTGKLKKMRHSFHHFNIN